MIREKYIGVCRGTTAGSKEDTGMAAPRDPDGGYEVATWQRIGIHALNRDKTF